MRIIFIVMLLPILGWTSTILGIFVMINLLFLGPSKDQFHIGCYLAPMNHTQTLKMRLEVAKEKATPLLYQHQSLVANQELFEKQLMKVASSLEKYVSELADQQRIRTKDLQIYRAIRQAEHDFQSCQEQLSRSINGSECHDSWGDYQNCFEEMEKARYRVDSLLLAEQTIQNDIAREIEQPEEDPEMKPEYIAGRAYNESIRNNDEMLAELNRRIGEAEESIDGGLRLRLQAQDRLSAKQLSYRQCNENRRIFQHCAQISDKVKKISSGILQQQKQQLQAKTKLMVEMQEMMVRETRKMPENWNEMYKKHREELKNMYKDFITNTRKDSTACGCSEQEEKFMLAEVHKEKKTIANYQEQIDSTKRLIAKLRADISQKELEREKIIEEYQKALRGYTTSLPEPQESTLIKLKKKLETNRMNILQMKDRYNQIDSSCDQVKQWLSANVVGVDRVESCLAKRDYLHRLRQETSKYLQPERSLARLIATKNQIAQAVASLGQQ